MTRARGSLSRRLLAASLLLLPLYLAATGAFLSRSFEASQLTAVETRLQGLFYALLGAIEFADDRPAPEQRLREPRLFQWRSGLYAWISDPTDGRLLWQSPSSEALTHTPASTLPPPPGSARFQVGDTLFEYQYQVIWEEDGHEQPLLINLAEDRAAAGAEIASFNRQLWVGLGGAALLLTVLQGLILRWGLRPLRRLSNDVGELERGRRAALAGDYARELQPLADNLNQLLEREAAQRNRYRNALADLAHSLKTPLAVLQQLDPSQHEEQRRQLQRMDRIVAYQLGRAVSAGAGGPGHEQPLAPLLNELRNTLLKVHAERRPVIDLELPPGLTLAADREDLLEIFGNLLDNACKACRRRVRVRAEGENGHWRIEVEDDGPGIPAQQRRELLQRGRRGDNYRDGHGIGLAVVADLLRSCRASLSIHDSELGGAALRISWPASRVSRE